MKYILIILDNQISMYEDILFQYKYSLDLKKIQNEYISYNDALQNNYLNNNKEQQLVFFGTKIKNFTIPENSILVDTDNVNLFEKHFPDNLVNQNIIVSYSLNTLNYLKNKFKNIRTGYFKFGYSKYLDFNNDIEKDVDILFFGSKSDRRENIINKLDKNFNCVRRENLYGIERTNLFQRSKIVLSIYSVDYSKYYNAGSRIYTVVSTGAFVIAEKCLDNDVLKDLEKICINVDYEDIESTIDYYLKNPVIREQKRLQFYENCKSLLSDIIYDY